MNTSVKTLNKISKENPVPFYLQVKEQLFSAIINDFEIGDKIQNEMDLCSIFGASRPTVRQAIKELENEGFLTRTKGYGTFVKSKKIETSLMQDVAFFTEELKIKHIKFVNKILIKDKIILKKEISKFLNLGEDIIVNYIERLRLVTNQPLYFTKIHVLDSVCRDFIDNDFVNNSTTDLIENKYKMHISSIKRYLNPVNRYAFPNAAEVLNIEKNTCFFYMRSILFDKEEKPIGFYEDFFSNEKSEFTFYTKR